jgi:hypothetical protein
MRRADLAMYEAKRRGRDQIVHYAREEPPPGQGVSTVSPSADGAAPAPPMSPVGQRPVVIQGPVPVAQPPPADAQPQAINSRPPTLTVTTGMSFDIPPESPFPAPWEKPQAAGDRRP